MTEEEYQFIGELYKEGFQNHITQELYDNIIDNNLMERELNKKTVIHQDNPFARGSYHTTSYKQLGITSSCDNTNCLIVISLDWLANPTVRSYDVIGALFHNVTRQSTPVTTYMDSISSNVTGTYKYASDGVGASFKLGTGTGLCKISATTSNGMKINAKNSPALESFLRLMAQTIRHDTHTMIPITQ